MQDLMEMHVLQMQQNAEIEKVDPLPCAGITTYSPIMYSKVKKGDKVDGVGMIFAFLFAK